MRPGRMPTSRSPTSPPGPRPGSASRRRRCRSCAAAGTGAGALLRLRAAQQRADPALRRASGTAATPDAGLAVLGVQAPRFPFGADERKVAAGLAPPRGRAFPVAIDAEREVWLDYGCEGWPSLFLWGTRRRAALVPLRRGRVRGDRGGDPGRAARGRRLRELPPPMRAAARRPTLPGATVMRPDPGALSGRRGRAAGPPPRTKPLALDLRGGRRLRDRRGRGSARLAAGRRCRSSVGRGRGRRALRARRAPPPRGATGSDRGRPRRRGRGLVGQLRPGVPADPA